MVFFVFNRQKLGTSFYDFRFLHNSYLCKVELTLWIQIFHHEFRQLGDLFHCNFDFFLIVSQCMFILVRNSKMHTFDLLLQFRIWELINMICEISSCSYVVAHEKVYCVNLLVILRKKRSINVYQEVFFGHQNRSIQQ